MKDLNRHHTNNSIIQTVYTIPNLVLKTGSTCGEHHDRNQTDITDNMDLITSVRGVISKLENVPVSFSVLKIIVLNFILFVGKYIRLSRKNNYLMI